MMESAAVSIGTVSIGIGNTSTLAPIGNDLGKKCFGFTKMDVGRDSRHQEIRLRQGYADKSMLATTEKIDDRIGV